MRADNKRLTIVAVDAWPGYSLCRWNMLTAITKFTRRAQLAFVLGIVAFVISGYQTCQQPTASEQAQMERYAFTKDAPEEESGSNLLVALGNLLGGLFR